MSERIFQITAKHFCAGFVVDCGKIAAIAPIIRYMQPWSGRKIVAYCKQKNWELKET